MPTRLFAVQIANGFSSEARVFASLLRHAKNLETRIVVQHEPQPGDESELPFEAASGRQVVRLDAGWRANNSGRHRNLVQKASPAVKFLFALRELERQAREFGAEAVYSSQQRWDCAAATFVAKRLNIPQIIHLHYIIGPWLGWQTLGRLQSCEQVVTVSDFIREEATRAGIDPARVTALRNAMELSPPYDRASRDEARAELGLCDGAVAAGMFARIDASKHQSDVLRAFEMVANRNPDVYMFFGGSGPSAEQLKRAINVSPFSDRVRFLGFRNDVQRLLSALDFAVHPSEDDPCPLAVLEAQAAGLPVVAYESGGIPELVSNEETGLLAETGDVVGLSQSLDKLYTDDAVRTEMGQAARARIMKDFKPEPASQRFEEIVEAVAKRGTSRR